VDRRRIDGVRIDVQAMTSISGRVLFDGHGVEGATVRVGDESDRHSTKANARGAYVLRGLPAGTYRGTAESAAGRGSIEAVAVGEGESRTGVDILLREVASISGTVLDTRGRPVMGALVKFEGAQTGDSGNAITVCKASSR